MCVYTVVLVLLDDASAEGVQTPSLMDAILKSVFYNVGKLLRSQKIITSTSERSLLKNLGSWLGKITLGREKPVLQRELDLKELLFQARNLVALMRYQSIRESSLPSCISPPPSSIFAYFAYFLHMVLYLSCLVSCFFSISRPSF